ncbi:MAG: hypothetical protein ABI861_08860 [Panacibacter sp.]
MNAEKTSFSKEIEELINKSVDVNKAFISESSRLMQQFTGPNRKNTVDIFKSNFLADAFTAYAKLNLQYMKNVLDLSVSLMRQAGEQGSENSANTSSEENSAPSFVLQAEAEAGSGISLSFLIDNIKEEEVICMLVNTPYYYQPDIAVAENFVTNFSPQSFVLKTGEQQKVKIDIITTKEAKPGLYISNVQVQGFEPTYFSVSLTIKGN